MGLKVCSGGIVVRRQESGVSNELSMLRTQIFRFIMFKFFIIPRPFRAEP